MLNIVHGATYQTYDCPECNGTGKVICTNTKGEIMGNIVYYNVTSPSDYTKCVTCGKDINKNGRYESFGLTCTKCRKSRVGTYGPFCSWNCMWAFDPYGEGKIHDIEQHTTDEKCAKCNGFGFLWDYNNPIRCIHGEINSHYYSNIHNWSGSTSTHEVNG